jgi:Tetratricopeptide repeat
MNRVGTTIVCAVALAAGCRGSDRSAPAAGSAGDDAAAASAPGDAAAASRHTLLVALGRGRALARTDDWAGAVAAFDRALQVAPGDPTALSELGWAALHAGDLDRAEQASAAAVAAATGRPRLEAASRYNLGRVREARGDPAGAASAYRASLALRPSRTVARHLQALEAGEAGPGAASGSGAASDSDSDSGADPDAGDDAVAGPYPDLAAYCDLRALADDDTAATCTGDPGVAAGPTRLAAPSAPLRAARVVGVRGALGDVTCELALETAAGWWIAGAVPCRTDTAAGRDWAASLALESPGPGRLVARFVVAYAARDAEPGRPGGHACEERVVACDVAGTRPACTPAVPIAWARSCGDPPPPGPPPHVRWDQQATWRLTAAGHLVVRPPAHPRPAPAAVSDLAPADLPLR